MNEFIEKLIAMLEEVFGTSVCEFVPDEYCEMANCAECEKTAIRNFITKFAEKYNIGWIPCSERLPETDDDVLCWYEYYRFGEYNGMYQTYGIGHYYKFMDFWGGEVSNGHKCRVIAWQPLPDPYKEEKH